MMETTFLHLYYRQGRKKGVGVKTIVNLLTVVVPEFILMKYLLIIPW